MSVGSPCMVLVSFDELLLAFECVGSGAPEETRAYICVKTGRIHLVSTLVDTDEDVPDDVETSEQYIRVPRRRELHLGRDLALAFVSADMADEWERASDIFRGRGAYGEFRQMLRARDMLDRWYAFEANAVEEALREWAYDSGIQFREVERAQRPATRR